MPADDRKEEPGNEGPADASAIDDIMAEEERHLAIHREAAAQGDKGGSAGEPHAEGQIDRAKLAKGYEKLLREGNEIKTLLLSMATHDLKTPLSALALQLHVADKFPGSEEHRKHAFKTMQQNVRRMTKMLDGLLDLARVEAGCLSVAPGEVDVNALIQECMASCEDLAKGKQLKLEGNVDEGLACWGDAGRMVQVLTNLISNSVRYSPPGGTIRLGAHETPDHVEIYVQDEGIGLTREQISMIFRPFVQVQGVPEESEGSGLGLYLSQAIVKAHGGRLWLESAGPGKGTRAVIELQKGEPPAGPSNPPERRQVHPEQN